MQSNNPATGRKWQSAAVALGVWAFWALLPAAMLQNVTTRAAAIAQLGATSAAYLEAAPQALCWYLILGQYVALPVLVALAWQVPSYAVRLEPAERAWRHWLPYLGSWALIYWAGNALVAWVDVRHGVDIDVVRGYAWHLGGYGFLATLPQLGLILTLRSAVRSSWLSAVLSLVSSALIAVLGLWLPTRGYPLPMPTLLRSEMLSGRAELVTHGAWLSAAWLLGFALLALSVTRLRSRNADSIAANVQPTV